MSSSAPEAVARHYRGANGNGITLLEAGDGAALQFVLKDQSRRRSFSARDIALLALGLLASTTTRSPVYLALGVCALAIALKSALFSDRTNILLLVESVGVHIISRKNLFGTLEEYLPWNSISDIFINEVITEQRVLYYLTFIVKEFTNNGEERVRLIPLFRDLKPERECLEYMSTENFPHSKELMKIIRRIIKWQPKQGQHFGTKNLLVTYNHAPWTRQDKMFAKMKFCDRPDAVAFPHAFILTVKLVDQAATTTGVVTGHPCEETNMGGTSAKIAPANPAMRAASTAETDGVAAAAAQQQTDDNSVQHCESLADATAAATTTTNGRTEGVNKNDDGVSRSLRTRSRLKDPDDSTDSTTTNVEPVGEEAAAAEKNVRSVNEVDGSSEKDAMDSDWGTTVLTKAAASGDASLTAKRAKETEEPIDQDEDSNDSSGSQSDSASLPYQYLIERDIERELLNARLSDKNESKENDAATANVARPPPPPVDYSCDSSIGGNDGDDDDADNDSKSSRESRKSGKLCRSRQDSRDNDTAPPPEVANLKSSDITDLVMKGLMFTIRQDSDSVTVVEQKTKLEVDEVLENSEKVETKEGDPCLRNSSLLRLEKMVTRIQDPASLPAQKHNGSSENALISFVDLADEINRDNEKRLSEAESAKENGENAENSMDTANCLSQFFNKDLSGAAFESFGKVWNENEIYHTDEEYELKDEDIVPEALVDQVFFNDKLDSANTPTVEGFEDLLMDDIQPFDDKINKEFLENVVLQKSDNTVVLNGTSVKDTSKLPKVISNELITNDQIPAVLLKSLKNKNSSPPQAKRIGSEKNEQIGSVPQSNNEQNVQEKTVEVEAKVESQSATKTPDKKTSLKLDGTEKAECVEKAKKVMEYNVKVVIQRHEDSNNTSNQENGIELNSDSNIEKRASVAEAVSDRKTRRSSVMKNSDVSNSNSSNSTRLTRSNSKIQGKHDEKLITEEVVSKTRPIVENSKSNKIRSPQKNERSIETRAHKLTEKKLENQENKTLSPSSGLSRKRKRSASDQDKSAFKFCKSVVVNGSEKKDVKVKVWKLINDLQYGVRVSVERMDIKNIPR